MSRREPLDKMTPPQKSQQMKPSGAPQKSPDSVTLPVSPELGLEVQPPPAAPDCRVLIADDNEELVHLLAQVFKMSEAPFHADFVMTGTGALSMLEARDYQCLVLDVKLPDLTGASVAAMVRERDDMIPIAFLTNYDSDVVESYGKIEGAVIWSKGEMLQNPPELIRSIISIMKTGKCREAPEGDGLHYHQSKQYRYIPAKFEMPDLLRQSVERYERQTARRASA